MPEYYSDPIPRHALVFWLISRWLFTQKSPTFFEREGISASFNFKVYEIFIFFLTFLSSGRQNWSSDHLNMQHTSTSQKIWGRMNQMARLQMYILNKKWLNDMPELQQLWDSDL